MDQTNTPPTQTSEMPPSAPVAPTPLPVSPAPSRGKLRLKGLFEFVRFAVMVVAIVVVVRVFIAQPFVVSGTSMVPTYQNSNYLIIDEVTYHFHGPVRGDVIVFHPPVDPKVYYIKRVIGLPGDTVTIKNSVVSITNAEWPDGHVITESYVTPDAPGDNFSITVPADNYFVMGDNRPASFDSRRWGLLPKKNITGRVFLRLFPLNKLGVFPGEHVAY